MRLGSGSCIAGHGNLGARRPVPDTDTFQKIKLESLELVAKQLGGGGLSNNVLFPSCIHLDQFYSCLNEIRAWRSHKSRYCTKFLVLNLDLDLKNTLECKQCSVHKTSMKIA